MKQNFSIIAISAFVVLLGSIPLTYATQSKPLTSSPPRGIRVQQTEDYFLVTWKKPLRHVDGYRIYRSNAKKILGKALITINDPNTNSFLDSSVKSNKKYYYTVRSFLSSGAESINRKQVSKKVTRKQRRIISIGSTCNRINNNTGGDGSYSTCMGDTITHSPSSLIAKALSFDNSKLTLSISGMPGNNTTTLSIYKNNFGYVGGNDGYEVIYKYGGYSPTTGANIFITSKASVNPPVVITLPPVTAPAVITSNVPKKFLTLITVISTKQKYDSWGNWIKFNENDNIQLFKVIIWDNDDYTAPKKIGLYKFDRTYDPYKEEYYSGGQAWVNYRESFNILNVDIPAAPNEKIGTGAPSSGDYLDAFKLIMETIVKNQPAEHYGIKFLGHGNGDVALFEWKINPTDSEILLAHINAIIGKKLDFLDWNTNCGVGTYKVALGQYRYADYILASDLIRGGYTLYSDIPVDSIKLAHEEILETFFSPGKSIKQSLIDMVNSERMFWEKALKRDMISKRLKHSISIYDTSKFEDLMASANLEQGIKSGYIDVLEYIRKNYPAPEQKFYDFRFHYVSNKDFFTWDYDFNGLRY